MKVYILFRGLEQLHHLSLRQPHRLILQAGIRRAQKQSTAFRQLSSRAFITKGEHCKVVALLCFSDILVDSICHNFDKLLRGA